MDKVKTSRKVYGITREEEEKQLAEIISIAQENLERTQQYNVELSDELKDMLESYETRDKEILALWHNTESRLQESKHDLMRCLKARNKPYFGRIDFIDSKLKKEESYYIGRVGIFKDALDPMVIDWRSPIASVYYENTLGKCTYDVKNSGTYTIDLTRKRTYEIANDKLIDFFDSDVVANDDLLTKYLAKSKKAVLGEIIGTIQKEQNTIIRKSPKTNLIVQGVAGSGKTTVAMHRISYILYNYENFHPQDFYVIGSNRILLNYITSVLPDLDVYGISQMTMEQLFIRLLYEDWDEAVYKVESLDRKDESACIKGSYEWFHELEAFCSEYEKKTIPMDDVKVEKNGTVLLDRIRIENFVKENTKLSVQGKINGLTEILMSKLENELSGRYVSYTPEEKKELTKQCEIHFGRDEWKGSIFEVYDEFLQNQKSKGHPITHKKNTFDVYDLAALAYLYKRIKEIDGIIEATHVIIDEAQDFGMMAYGALAYCLRGCTYTIMGDVSQNIHFGYGLNDWEDLRKLILTETYDSFGLLKKSYRNTMEISHFATEILKHGTFPIYPVEPIIRHGNEVRVTACKNEKDMIEQTAKIISGWQKEGHETIAVICRDETEAAEVTKQLGSRVKLCDSNLETAEFEQGVMVLPVEYSKGLEFDAVLIYHPSETNYPASNQYVKLLYVAATRALHELAVVHIGDLTELIAKPVSKDKQMQLLENEKVPKQREYRKNDYVISEEKKQEDLERYLQRTKKSFEAKGMNTKASQNSTQMTNGENSPKTEAVNRANAEAQNRPYEEAQNRPYAGTGSAMQEKGRTTVTSNQPPKVSSRWMPVSDKTVNTSIHQFNEVPGTSYLYPKGHSRVNNSIKWAKRTKQYMDLVSSYGVLRITPIQDAILRVQFQRGQTAEFEPGYWNHVPDVPVTWNARESTTQLEISTSQIIVRIDKKTGLIKFMNNRGVSLLNEKGNLPRQIEVDTNGVLTWNYFDWAKNEKLYAKGILNETLERMDQKARYISFGGKNLRMPLLISDKGYGLGIAAESTVMCCNLSMYGPYIYTEQMKQVDYYFIYGGNTPGVLEYYKGLTTK